MRRTSKLVYELLALLCLLLSAVMLLMVRVHLAPTQAPEATVETTPAPTPCAHPEFRSGVCTECGFVCAHEWENGICTICGTVCAHERHGEEDGVCLSCGLVVPHRLHAAKCTRCGYEVVFTNKPLTESMTEPCPEPGSVETIELGAYLRRKDGKTPVMPAVVYLPYGYDAADETLRYNLVIALHGAYSDEHSMVDERHVVKGVGAIRFQDVYDNLIYSGLTDPFILVAINTYVMAGEESWTEDGSDRLAQELRERVLPYMAEHYRSYAADATQESISAARAHIGVVGLSNGALYALRAAMAENLAFFGGFGCFSANFPETTACVLETLGDPETERYAVQCFFTGAGTRDFQQSNTELRYHEILDNTERLEEGLNAFHTDIEGSHDWITWGAELYNCLQVLFQEP